MRNINFKLNNKGFGAKETMIVMVIVLIFIAVIAYKALGVGENLTSEFSKFDSLVSDFISEAGTLRDTEAIYETRVFLYDLNKYNGTKYANPFEGSEYCDVYESSLQMNNNLGYVTFKCGDYIIYNERTNTEEFTIYKVSEWTDEEITGENVQIINFYNYEENGELQLDDYYIEKEFLLEYNKKNGTTYLYLESVDSPHNLVTKNYYRTMEKVR